MSDFVTVVTGCRIHFGLCPLAGQKQKFAGLGASLKSPGHRIHFSPAKRLVVEGIDKQRVLKVIKRIVAEDQLKDCGGVSRDIESLPVRVCGQQTIQPHQGLGSGTQLELAIAHGLTRFFEIGTFDGWQAAPLLQRGNRSKVGTHAYLTGGLIFDSGDGTWESPIIHRMDVPDAWRVLLVLPKTVRGLSGIAEAEGFEAIGCGDVELGETMVGLAIETILPAAVRGDFAAFSRAIEEYGRLAGSSFEAVQGGIYHGQLVTDIVMGLVKRGALGVGQSSWGPCVYAWFENQESAKTFVVRNQSMFDDRVEWHIAQPKNEGAQLNAAPIEMKGIA